MKVRKNPAGIESITKGQLNEIGKVLNRITKNKNGKSAFQHVK